MAGGPTKKDGDGGSEDANEAVARVAPRGGVATLAAGVSASGALAGTWTIGRSINNQTGTPPEHERLAPLLDREAGPTAAPLAHGFLPPGERKVSISSWGR
jgi:hypothetical protein